MKKPTKKTSPKKTKKISLDKTQTLYVLYAADNAYNWDTIIPLKFNDSFDSWDNGHEDLYISEDISKHGLTIHEQGYFYMSHNKEEVETFLEGVKAERSRIMKSITKGNE